MVLERVDRQYEDGAGYACFALVAGVKVGPAIIVVGFRVDYDVDSNFNTGQEVKTIRIVKIRDTGWV